MKKMLAQINIELEANGLSTNMGSLFHGYLMENIDSAYADYFHYNTTNPFTSCIYKVINFFGELQHIIKRLMICL